MKKSMIIAVLASTAAGMSSSQAQVIRQHEGVMPETSFKCLSNDKPIFFSGLGFN